jgi:hypothetical protein
MNKFIKKFRALIHDAVILLVPKGIRKSFMPSCQQVSEMLEAESLGFRKIIKLKMHLFICQCCVDYKNQVSIISAQARELGKIELTEAQKRKVQSSKSSILKSIKSKK